MEDNNLFEDIFSAQKDKTQFENILRANRTQLTPKQSIIEDAKHRSRSLRLFKASTLLSALLMSFPLYYFSIGLYSGCWRALHSDNALNVAYAGIGRPFRLQYRPEVYLRDKQASFYEIDRQNIQIEKMGQTPKVTSPIVLWH